MAQPSSPRIAVIGAGSYVFSLGLLYDLVVASRLQGAEIALMDVNTEMLDIMARICRRMAQEAKVDVTVVPTTDRIEALTGADYVTTSVAVQLRQRWQMDKDVMHRHGIREIYSECGGLGGLSYALRSVALVHGIARDMERVCPDAWLLNSTNPLPRVIAAVRRHTGIKAVGFCNAALGAADGYGTVATLLKRDVNDINVLSAGTNHFAWLLSAQDRWTGEDLMPQVRCALDAGPTTQDHYAFGQLTMRYWKRYGYFPLAGDNHTGEYLPYEPDICPEYIAHHGDENERAARRQLLADAADGKIAWQALFGGRSWERPGLFVHAMATGLRRRFDALNIPNQGALPDLPDDAIVEVPAVVEGGTLTPVHVGTLPSPINDMCRVTSQVHTLVADGAALGDRGLLREAIAVDPAIPDKAAAVEALDELIAVHADQLPQFDVPAAK